MRAVAASCLVISGCASTRRKAVFDSVLTETANTARSSLEALPAGHANLKAARLPTADSRLGAWLFAGGEQHNRLYLSRLREKGVDRVVYRIAYPALKETDPSFERFRDFYSWLARQVQNYGMQSIVVVSPQYRDDNYYRGQAVNNQCSDIEQTSIQMSDHLAQVERVVRPESLVLDVRPSTLERVRGCESWANNQRAADLVDRILDIATPAVLEKLSIGVNLSTNQVFRSFVIAHPKVQSVSISTLDFGGSNPVDFLKAWEDVVRSVQAMNKRAVSDEFWMRKPVRLNGCDGQPIAITDTASVWQSVDQALLSRANGSTDFMAVYETDLLFGGYLDAEDFQCGEGFVLKNRRLSQLASRKVRRYRAPTDATT